MSKLATVILLAIIIIPSAVLVGGAYNNWIIGLEYQREIGVYFEYADRSSDAKVKSDYFNQYVEAIKEHGLDKGSSSVYFQDQPNASLEDNFRVAQSLQTRLNEIADIDPKSPEYQFAMQQVTMQEFCWFPTSAFYQGYLLSHGGWGMALIPAGTYDRCYTPPPSS